jgi:hypothetical protein
MLLLVKENQKTADTIVNLFRQAASLLDKKERMESKRRVLTEQKSALGLDIPLDNPLHGV